MLVICEQICLRAQSKYIFYLTLEKGYLHWASFKQILVSEVSQLC